MAERAKKIVASYVVLAVVSVLVYLVPESHPWGWSVLIIVAGGALVPMAIFTKAPKLKLR